MEQKKKRSHIKHQNIFYVYFLRYRNSKKELNDIRFEFAVGKDSADGIASELVGAGLVDSRDMAAITNNLQKLIDSRENLKVVTFPLVGTFVCTKFFFLIFLLISIFQNSGVNNNETPDDKALIGFAQISITD